MKTNRFWQLIAMVTVVMGLSSCSNDENTENASNSSELKIVASMAPVLKLTTRAAYDLQSTSIYGGDFTKVGMYIWKSGATAASTSPAYGYQNLQMTTGTPDDVTTPTYYTLTKTGTEFYFPADLADVDVYLYAPWNSTAANETMVSPAFTVSADQSAAADYVASDFIYGKATASYTGTGAKTAKVTMYHALSKIILKVNPAAGVDVSGLTELKLTGVKRTTSIRMANAPSTSMTVGTATTDHVDVASTTSGDGTDVIVTNATNYVLADARDYGVAAIIPPQALTGLGISCTISGKTATKSLANLTYDDGGDDTSIGSFLPGKVYTITLNVKTGILEVQLISIYPWESGNGVGSQLDLDF